MKEANEAASPKNGASAKTESGATEGKATGPDEGERLRKDLAAAQEEAAKWKNEYFLSLADTQNLRKSLQEDHREAVRYRAEGFLEELLPALDSFYMALSVSPKGEEAKNYQQGFQYIYNQLKAALDAEGVKEIIPKPGDRFDPSVMHAVDAVEGDDEDKVAKVYSKGYKLHERLIRPSMVAVYKKKGGEKPGETPAKETQAASDGAKKDSEAGKA